MVLFGKQTKWMLYCLIFYLINNTICIPVDTDNSWIVSSTAVPQMDKISGKEGNADTLQSTRIYQVQILSQISNRFVHTTVLSKVQNEANKSQEATFSIVLPDSAFISDFVMEIDGKNYTAYVKEKEEAKKTYEQAVASGQSAAHVAVTARDSNRFTVSVNVESESKAAFYLKYEELLIRQENHYELVINLHPGQPVKDLSVKVSISESRKIKELRVPPLRSGNEIGNEKPELDSRADISVIDEKNAVVIFNPNLERQKQLSNILGTTEANGLAGQFVVQYDVERDPQGGEVLVQDGYFVHFFAPSELQPLPKHVVFVLDTSGSMRGQKIVQLRESMVKILEQLNEQDMFQLVEFNSVVQVLDIDEPEKNVKYPNENVYHSSEKESYPPLNSIEFGPPYIANNDNIKRAKSAVTNLSPGGSTDIYTGLEVGLYLVELEKINNITHQPIIMFLTDGSPNVRIRSINEITTKISEYNSGKRKSAIFTLAFGNSANKDSLQKLAGRNNGFSRQIYEAADASLQLQNFYKQISSPLLADVSFKYEPSTTSLTVTEFPIHFGGSELVVAGCYSNSDFVPPTIDGRGRLGWVSLRPTVQRSVSFVERTWAYLTLKQLLDKKEVSDTDSENVKKKALDLALKYQFVTAVSSLVVVKPNATTDAVDIEAADKNQLPPNIYKKMKTSVGYDSASYDLISTRDFVGLPEQSGRGTGRSRARSKVKVSLTEQSVFPYLQKDIFSSLAWLKEILNDGVLALSKGKYKLGLNETIAETLECSNAPQNGTGHCTLIHSCDRIYPLLTSKVVYELHFCVLKDDYAGVCCPEV